MGVVKYKEHPKTHRVEPVFYSGGNYKDGYFSDGTKFESSQYSNLSIAWFWKFVKILLRR